MNATVRAAIDASLAALTATAKIPEAPFYYGGDSRESFQSLKPGRAKVPGFFMKRLEATFGEYLAFLNGTDLPINRDETSDEFGTTPTRKQTRELLEALGISSSDSVQLVPRRGSGEPGTTYYLGYSSERARWERRFKGSLHIPVMGLTISAALEYASWLTEKHGGKKRL